MAVALGVVETRSTFHLDGRMVDAKIPIEHGFDGRSCGDFIDKFVDYRMKSHHRALARYRPRVEVVHLQNARDLIG